MPDAYVLRKDLDVGAQHVLYDEFGTVAGGQRTERRLKKGDCLGAIVQFPRRLAADLIVLLCSVVLRQGMAEGTPLPGSQVRAHRYA
ncbi:MAG: hypothetical protein P4N24_07320 [Acidobacteriota bacterium]|nr:hypothetical protein [Acidobacteriota bacterium]